MDMPKHKKTAPTGGDGDDYKVGYGRPPQHSQFRPGQSGNPAGRPKGLNNLATDVKRTLEEPVRVKEGGRPRKISTQRGVLMRLREKALLGDDHALDLLLKLEHRFNNEASEIVAQDLPADDQAILADYRAEILADALQTTPAEPPGRERVEARTTSSTAKDESFK